jgi:hypothetical protein
MGFQFRPATALEREAQLNKVIEQIKREGGDPFGRGTPGMEARPAEAGPAKGAGQGDGEHVKVLKEIRDDARHKRTQPAAAPHPAVSLGPPRPKWNRWQHA